MIRPFRSSLAAVVAATACALAASTAPVVAPRADAAAAVVRPTVASLARVDTSPTKPGTVRWLATFSEPVTNVTLANFTLSASGFQTAPVLASISPSAGFSATFTVSAAAGALTGSSATLRLNLSSVGSGSTAIKNASGGVLKATFSGESYSFDGAAPAVTLTKVNGAASSFPRTLQAAVTSVGGTCGRATGDTATVSLAVTGPMALAASAPCVGGAWSSAITLGQGTFTFTATQSDAVGNVGTSGPKQLTVQLPNTAPPVVTLATINGSTSIEGSALAFPVTTRTQVTSVGGSCGTLPGDSNRVRVAITGASARSGTAACTAGSWSLTLSKPLPNNGSGDGDYVITATQTATGRPDGTAGPHTLTMATKTFGVAGAPVAELYPDGSSELQLTVTNPYPFQIRIEAITVSFSGPATCDATNFTVDRPFAGPLVIAPGATTLPRSAAPRIKMIDKPVSQDGCRNTRVGLAFTGLATRA